MFRRIHMVEAWGRGMPLILRNAPDAQFKEIDGIFIVGFARPSAKVQPNVSEKMSEKMSEKTRTTTKADPKKTPRRRGWLTL